MIFHILGGIFLLASIITLFIAGIKYLWCDQEQERTSRKIQKLQREYCDPRVKNVREGEE